MNPRRRKEIQLSLPPAPRPSAARALPVPGASWEVRARAHHSFASRTPFDEGDVICSRLVREGKEVVREDYLQGEWTADLAAGAMFHWKTKYRKPAPKKEPPFREENAEDLLQDLLEQKNPDTVNTVYILALMLERKRILIERGTLQDVDGGLVRVYEKKDGGETYMIQDPQLNLNQLADVQQEVALQLGWIKAPEPAPAGGGDAAVPENPEEDLSEKNSQEEVDNTARERL